MDVSSRQILRFSRHSSSFIIALLLLSACGKSQEFKSDGTIAVINGEQKVIQDPEEAKAVCEQNFCEPNYLVYEAFGRKRKPSTTPQPDSTFGTFDSYDYSRKKMNLKPAWDITEGSPEIVVANIDSGVDLAHPDLKDNFWVNSAESNGAPGVDDDQNGFVDDVVGYDFYSRRASPTDEKGHGTHTAGIIAAAKNNLGVVGIAPKVRLMNLRFMGADGSGRVSDAILAINYAVKMGAKVISASWGGPAYSVLLADAVKNAIEAGVVFVAAAGNDSVDMTNNPFYPAMYDNVISVAATDSNDRLAEYSNFSRSRVTLSASGTEINSTYLNQSYKKMSGTSMAAPQVAGAVALALSKNKSVLPGAIRAALCASTDSPTRDSTQCGRMNIGRFVESI